MNLKFKCIVTKECSHEIRDPPLEEIQPQMVTRDTFEMPVNTRCKSVSTDIL